MHEKDEARRANGGQRQDIPGNNSSSCKILPFRRPTVKPQPAPMPEGFDLAVSRRLDMLVYVDQMVHAEKRLLESFVPLERVQ